MKNIKKLSAALLAVVMLVSMLSCMVLSTAAATFNVGEGPVTIEKVEAGSGIVVGGKNLPNGVRVVNSSWKGAKGDVTIKLGGVAYRCRMGETAFADLIDATIAAKRNDTIYVAAGVYESNISINAGGLKIYGPYAGVNPNDRYDLAWPNWERPAGDPSWGTEDEAVYTGIITVSKAGSDLTVDGMYFGGASGFITAPSMTGNENYRYGTYLYNNIINSSKGQFIYYSGGHNPNFEFKYNRVLNATVLADYAGLMDVVISDNYLNLKGTTVDLKRVTAGSMGSYALIENNYYENCNGTFYFHTGETCTETLAYTAIVRNNIINDMGPAAVLKNAFYARNTLPGTNIQFTGNMIYGMESGVTAFEFPYFASQENPSRFRHIININENYFDIPEDAMFIESDNNGIIDCSYNYYTSPMNLGRVTKYEFANLILYPYYNSPAMMKDDVSGGPRFKAVMPGASIDEENRIITIDIAYSDPEAAGKLDATKALTVEDGATWKLYEEKTLETEIREKVIFYDAEDPYYYAEITSADGTGSAVYEIRLRTAPGIYAELVALTFDGGLLEPTYRSDGAWVYDLDILKPNTAIMDVDVKVSFGAKYTLYSDATMETELKEIPSYIPYDGYKFYVFVEAEDPAAAQNIFSVELNRSKSTVFDPSVVALKSPANGEYQLRIDRWNPNQLYMTYYCDYLMNKAAFDFEVTPGATYVLYEDAAITKALSSSPDVKELALKPGTNTFYVKVTAADGSNVMKLVVENETKSSDATIIGAAGLTTVINDNKIIIQGGGNSMTIVFDTRDPYAVVDVYADPAKKTKLEYTSTPVEGEPNRIIDERTFKLDITHATSNYYLDCVAEDGTKQAYVLVVEKLVNAYTYVDVSDEAWYAKYVEAATAKGIIVGSPSGKDYYFNPENNTSRQEMAIVATRLLGINTEAFKDVVLPYSDKASIAEWALGNVQVCYSTGIMIGSDGGFKPNDSISRQEVMVMFARMYNLTGSYDLTSFADHADVASWAKTYVEAVVSSGLILGKDDGKLHPNAPITRAELATIIARV